MADLQQAVRACPSILCAMKRLGKMKLNQKVAGIADRMPVWQAFRVNVEFFG
jgi:hypothetical protein